MLTLRRSSLMSLAARKRRRKPTLTICVASTMLPTTVMKSNAFHGSLKYGCGTEKWVVRFGPCYKRGQIPSDKINMSFNS